MSEQDRGDQVESLLRALETRSLIGQAMGILMERYDLSADVAFATLNRLASSSDTKVIQVEHQLVETRHHYDLEPLLQLSHHTSAAPVERPRPARAPLGGGVVTYPTGLSEREHQVIALIAAGASNQEISATLFIGLNTVKTYIRTAYRKIGATRRAQAVIWGREHGMHETDTDTAAIR